jgi:four helix bundle protein
MHPKAEELRNRTKQFALRGIKLFQNLPKTEEARIIGKQFIRSCTSVASNYRAACRARSDAEFYSKLCIVVEEADECLFWLEIITEAGIMQVEKLENLMQETEEILKIVSASRKTVGEKLGR